MERLTGKGAKSLKEAYAKVYSEQYPTPDYASMSDEEFDALVRKSGNPEGLLAKRKNQLERAAVERTRKGYTADDAKADQERAKVEAENRRRASRGEDPLPTSQTSQPARASQPTAKPPTDQQRVRTEYDRLRNSKDPDERAQAVRYGRQMAAAGAAKKDFSGYQSAADAQKNLPAPAQRMSISQRIQAIRNIRAAKPAAISPNQQSSLNSTVRSGTSQVPTGNTIKTKVNPDSSLKVTQKRTPAETARIKQSLDIQSADLFDIIQGEFIEEGYTQEDTIYMMANLNEEQLQEFMKYVQGAINVGKRVPGIRGVINKVGAMFNRAPKQMPSGQVGALRLYQDKARQSVNRLNQQTPKLDARAAQREANRVNNLNPTAVSNRNRREAAAQMRQRNRELGRPESAGVQPVDRLDYKPGDPMFDDFVKRHHADKRGGVVKFTDGARRIDK